MNWNTKFVSTVCHRQSPDHVMAENGSWKNFHVFNFLGKFALVTWKTTPTIKQNKTHIKYIAQITVIWRFTHIPRPWELLRTPPNLNACSFKSIDGMNSKFGDFAYNLSGSILVWHDWSRNLMYLYMWSPYFDFSYL